MRMKLVLAVLTAMPEGVPKRAVVHGVR